jgi:uncharacterized Zn finger protein (UPF0148 family)
MSSPPCAKTRGHIADPLAEESVEDLARAIGQAPLPAWAAGLCPDCGIPLTEKQAETFCHSCAYDELRDSDPLLQAEDGADACWNSFVYAAEAGDDRHAAQYHRDYLQETATVHRLRRSQRLPSKLTPVRMRGRSRGPRCGTSRRRGSRRTSASRADPDESDDSEPALGGPLTRSIGGAS